MSYTKKSYGYTSDGKQVCFNGHISKETANKRGFVKVTLAVYDNSGKGRGGSRHFLRPFTDLRKF